ncbi:DUF6000 family protein [Cryptosporangium japonicum]|uniref:Uncharacterized protein n=1 Tax=Cryptosporangium japonicum TaxID=80872 RepID=A0ABP3DX98_9ACTN
MLSATEADFVKPFYLRMKGLAAVRLPDELRVRVLTAAGLVTVGEVTGMLRAENWRPVVMGAWFSLTVPAESVRATLLEAMSRSRGSLTAPPLAAAATLLGGPAAVPSMVSYLDHILTSRRDGSEHVVAAAVEYLDADPPITPTDEGRRAFRSLLNVATTLRDDARTP